MKFLGLSVMAFSLASQVFAAPTSLGKNLPAVNGISGGVNVAATAVVGNVIDAAAKVEAKTLVKNSASPVMIILGAVDTLKNDVEAELQNLTVAVAADITVTVVPTVLASVKSIGVSLQTALNIITSALASIVVPLTQDELAALVTVLQDLHVLVVDIESTLKSILASLTADAIALIQSEVTVVLQLVLPVVTPVASFALSVVGTIVGSDGVVSQIKGLAGSLTSIVDTLLDPVGELLVALTS